ncbi:unnamed protein product [Rotaria sordida]|uniref:Uncharacterized protein n=1 Tax=Rotaria sordida TaxID=392033 RepID=A0A819XVH4_9BILA|nr:unnamed protein product [Rotaria sordida]
MTYLDADRWEELILKYLPQLEKFYSKYEIFFNIDDENSMYLGKSYQLASSFWIGRKLVSESEIDYEHITYLIELYGIYRLLFGKRWYEDDTQYNELSQSMRIALTTVALIYHLKIRNNRFNGTLIEILYLLRELDSLQISSMSLSQSEYLSIDEVEVDAISKKN